MSAANSKSRWQDPPLHASEPGEVRAYVVAQVAGAVVGGGVMLGTVEESDALAAETSEPLGGETGDGLGGVTETVAGAYDVSTVNEV